MATLMVGSDMARVEVVAAAMELVVAMEVIEEVAMQVVAMVVDVVTMEAAATEVVVAMEVPEVTDATEETAMKVVVAMEVTGEAGMEVMAVAAAVVAVKVVAVAVVAEGMVLALISSSMTEWDVMLSRLDFEQPN